MTSDNLVVADLYQRSCGTTDEMIVQDLISPGVGVQTQRCAFSHRTRRRPMAPSITDGVDQ